MWRSRKTPRGRVVTSLVLILGLVLGLVLVSISFRFVSFSPLDRSTTDFLVHHFSFFFSFFSPSARAVKIKTGEFEAARDIYTSSCNRILWPNNF